MLLLRYVFFVLVECFFGIIWRLISIMLELNRSRLLVQRNIVLDQIQELLSQEHPVILQVRTILRDGSICTSIPVF